MATTRIIQTKMWRDSWFVGLSDAAAKLFMYLITNDSTRLSGFYELPVPQIAAAIGKTADEVGALFKELEGKIEYVNGWVCIRNYAQHQNVSNNPKVQVFVEKDLAEVPENVQHEAHQRFNSYSQSHSLSHSKGIDTHAIGYGEKKNGSTTSQKSGTKKGGKAGDKKGTASLYDDERFERWWTVYPKKVGKGAAWKSWQMLNPNAQLGEQIIAVTLLYAKTPQWTKDGGQFVPNPATFLNQRRFDDTPQGGSTTSDKYKDL